MQLILINGAMKVYSYLISSTVFLLTINGWAILLIQLKKGKCCRCLWQANAAITQTQMMPGIFYNLWKAKIEYKKDPFFIMQTQ